MASAKTKDDTEIIEEGNIPLLATHAADWGMKVAQALLTLAELLILMTVPTPQKGFTVIATWNLRTGLPAHSLMH